MSTESEVKALAEKVAAAQAVVVQKRQKGTPEDLDEAMSAWNELVAEYDKAVDDWADAGFPKDGTS